MAEDSGNGNSGADSETRDPKWADIEQLISEAKFEAASTLGTEVLENARSEGKEAEWTRALILQVQLRVGLHGYEKAVRFLHEEKWPQSPLQRAVLNLFYAHSLVTYNRAYSWEISQRERLDTGETIDLKAWTRDQIVSEAHRAYLEVWNGRDDWGDASLGTLAEYLHQNDYPPRIRGG